MILSLDKISFICDFAKRAKKSSLKNFIIEQHSHGALNAEEVAALFVMYDLKGE